MKRILFIVIGVVIGVAIVVLAISSRKSRTGINIQLISACASGNLSEVKRLLEAGAQLSFQTSGTGFTPLHWAVYEEEYEIARFLLDQGADPRVKDSHNETVEDLLKKQMDSKEAASLLRDIEQRK